MMTAAEEKWSYISQWRSQRVSRHRKLPGQAKFRAPIHLRGSVLKQVIPGARSATSSSQPLAPVGQLVAPIGGLDPDLLVRIANPRARPSAPPAVASAALYPGEEIVYDVVDLLWPVQLYPVSRPADDHMVKWRAETVQTEWRIGRRPND
jgi:hypothetical protein